MGTLNILYLLKKWMGFLYAKTSNFIENCFSNLQQNPSTYNTSRDKNNTPTWPILKKNASITTSQKFIFDTESHLQSDCLIQRVTCNQKGLFYS